MNLSDNLTLKEATKSNTAIKNGINNTPTDEHLTSLIEVAQKVFQPIRDHFNCPIKVTSGYRSQALNEIIGGSKTSQHSKGEALDLDADVFGGCTNAEIFDYIVQNLDFDQLIWEYGDHDNPDWVHVSYKRSDNRKEILRCRRVNGSTVYERL